MVNDPNRPVYLDNQATTPCDPRVVAQMLPWFGERFGNAHSAEHVMGREARQAVEAARGHVASMLGSEPREVIFTSGATEANNLAIKGAARFAASQGGTRRRIISFATEHKCVLEAVSDLREEGFEPVVLPVKPDGLADLERFQAALTEPTLLVSGMMVNNETGVVQDIGQVASRAHAAGALFHTDAAQAAGKLPVDVAALNVDLLSVSAHKLYGPKGIGALFVRRRPRTRLAPLFSGGGQERGLRAGTLPTPLIVGFGEACRLAVAEMDTDTERIASLRDRLLGHLTKNWPAIRLNGHATARIAGNLNLAFPGVSARMLIEGAPDLCVSTGSACSSAELEPSYVLRAMAVPPEVAARSLRIGIGRFTSTADIDFAAAALADAHASARVAADA